MKHSAIEVEQVIDWLCEAVPAWKKAVTVGQLIKASPHIPRRRMAMALKHLTRTGVLWCELRDDVSYYAPEALRPYCGIQELICLGPRQFCERAAR